MRCVQLARGYATKDAQLLFWPSPLGEALVGAYRKMGLTSLWQPALRYTSPKQDEEMETWNSPKKKIRNIKTCLS